MRILITIHQFFPKYKAGTEVLALSIVKELIRREHDVRVFTGHPSKHNLTEYERFDEYKYQGIHIYRFHHSYTSMLNQISMLDLGYNNKLAKYYFVKVCEKFQPQLVHHFHLNRLGISIIHYLADSGIAQYFTPTDFWMICPTGQLMLKNRSCCKGPNKLLGNCIKHLTQNYVNHFLAKIIQIIPDIVFNQIGYFTKKYKNINYPMSHEIKVIIYRVENTIKALNRLQGVISPNCFMSNLLIKYGLNKAIIYEKSFGIDINQESVRNTHKKKIKNQPLRIAFIGTLAPHKGCDIAIKAINLLPSNFAILTIFGNGEEFPDYVQELYSLAARKKNILFKKEFSNKKIISVLSKFDALVVPSIWFENTPLVIYAAQAAHCPVIGSNLPGISALIFNNINGLLFKSGNHKDLCEKIKRLKDTDLKYSGNNSVPLKTSRQYVDDICNIWGKYINKL